MAIAQAVEVIETALWPQGDARDPLGVWGARALLTADATGGGIKITMEVPAGKRASFVYTCYGANITQLTGTLAGSNLKTRLLTNWPNIDPQAGVQAFSTFIRTEIQGDAEFTAPIAGNADFHNMGPNDRFLLLFDPRAISTAMAIVEMEIGENVDGLTYGAEAYGYYWDRQILNTPGGPRHPGAT